MIFIFWYFIMAAKIAPTTFAAGPDNKAVTVDVYKTPPLKPVNNQPAKEDKGILAELTNSENKKINALKAISKRYAETGKVLPDRDTIVKNIGNVFGVTNGTVSTVSGKIMDNLLRANGFYGTGIGKTVDRLSRTISGKSFSTSLLTGFTDITLEVNKVKQEIKKVRDFDFTNLSDLSSAIAKISGDSSFIRLANLTEAAGIVKALNDMATSLYIPGVADRLLRDMSKEDRRTVVGLVNAGLTSVNDLSTLDTLINNLSPEEILNTNPNIIRLAVAGYNGGNTFIKPSKEAADALLLRLRTINPHWDSVRVGPGIYRSDLEVFKSFSGFARDSFIAAGYYTVELAIASSYVPKEFTTLTKELFPLIGFKG